MERGPRERITMKVKIRSFSGVLALALLLGCETAPDPGLFSTPEEAIAALSALVGKNDEAGIEAVFGPGSLDVFQSGDPEGDHEDAEHVKSMIEDGVEFEDLDENTKIALLGESAWPWPIPLVRSGDGWRFSVDDGRQELLNRRIGRNELWTLTALHEIVDAQREYRRVGRDGNPRAYAGKFFSSEGKHDGLYWPSDDAANRSPLGELLADSDGGSAEPKPFHGYFYRILTRRGENAPEGAREYLNKDGLLTGGFAVVAWPATYGNSGVMTFITNRQGLVYQQDLGEDTEALAAAIDSYEPDASWTPTPDLLWAEDSL